MAQICIVWRRVFWPARFTPIQISKATAHSSHSCFSFRRKPSTSWPRSSQTEVQPETEVLNNMTFARADYSPWLNIETAWNGRAPLAQAPCLSLKTRLSNMTVTAKLHKTCMLIGTWYKYTLQKQKTRIWYDRICLKTLEFTPLPWVR